MIKSITLEINGKEISLTGEEARKLYNELETFYAPKKDYFPQMPWYTPPIQPISDPRWPGDVFIYRDTTSSKYFLTESDIS